MSGRELQPSNKPGAACFANTSNPSVPRRYSSGAQHAGRGGAGNVFKDDTEELARTASREQAVVDDTERPETPSKSRKGWFFGKKA